VLVEEVDVELLTDAKYTPTPAISTMTTIIPTTTSLEMAA
jgi:hypothetical protein